MTSNEIRAPFLRYFEKNGHRVVASSPLVPGDDPTLLFTNAGMNQFKDVFLGREKRDYVRAATSQKVMRVSGKHNDLDNVGPSHHHHTFFEMLGNFSFGDYFKRDAIRFSWELLTGVWKMPPDRLIPSIFKGERGIPRDDEAFEIWTQFVPADRILELGLDDNFWQMGETGPCGRSSEIYYTRGSGSNPEVEIWNNVFMEFNKTADGRFEPLSQRNVDTGMGLERTLVALGGFQTVFQIDTFQALLSTIGALSNKTYGNHPDDDRAMRVIADHVRTAAFILGDTRALTPSNVDQGYILRRLIRRAVRYGRQLGIAGSFTATIAQKVVQIFGAAYPELQKNASRIAAELNAEEDKFSRTLQNGLREVDRVRREVAASGEIPGETAFYLYESFGFPRELTEEVLGRKVDTASWNAAMKAHQDRSRQGAERKFKGGLADHSWTSTRYHTATHLLHKALRDVLGTHVEQRGSNITAERMRFDFSHPQKMTPAEIQRVEGIVNEAITRDLRVHYEEMTVDQAKARGAIGLFEDRYGDKIKVYVVSDFSSEICGGPHVGHTAQIGRFRIVKEEASSAGIRRIKAVLEDVSPDGAPTAPESEPAGALPRT
jgi:alanyl-tRNA synthetase